MSQTIAIVVYKGYERIIAGEGTVEEDGTFTGRIINQDVLSRMMAGRKLSWSLGSLEIELSEEALAEQLQAYAPNIRNFDHLPDRRYPEWRTWAEDKLLGWYR